MINDQAWLIYLAALYSSQDPDQERVNAKLAALCTAVLMKQGHMIYAPTVHGHAVSHYTPIPYATWIQHGLRMLRNCDELFVLCLEGWESSKGVDMEIKYALEHDIPIRHVTPVAEGEYTISYGLPKCPPRPE